MRRQKTGIIINQELNPNLSKDHNNQVAKDINNKQASIKVDEDSGKTASEMIESAQHTDDDLLMALTTDIIDKQYRLYSWADSKTLSLITTNSILLATIGFLFKECLADTFSLLALIVSLSLIGISLYFSLIQVTPQGSSGKGLSTEPNLKALSGILNFENWESYHEALLKIDKKNLCVYSARQIFGMANNTDKSRKMTTKGVKFTITGIFFMFLSVIGVSLSARNINILGKWALIESVNPVKTSLENTTQNTFKASSLQSPSDNSKTKPK